MYNLSITIAWVFGRLRRRSKAPWFRDSPFQKKAHGFPCDPKVPEKSISILTQIFLCEIFGGDQKQIRSNCEVWDVFQRLQLLSCESSFEVKKIRELIPLRQKHVQTRPLNQKMQRGSSLPKISSNLRFFFSTNIFQVVSRWRSPQGLPVRAPFHQTLQIPKNGGMNTYKSWADVRKNLHLYDKLYGYGLCKPTK